MFTGIIEDVGRVEKADTTDAGARFTVSSVVAAGLDVGDSVAVNGVCLTAVELGEDTFSVDVVTETLRRSNLGSIVAGSAVNVERAMPATGRFDGHIVQGHVDGTGSLVAARPEGSGLRWKITAPDGVLRYVVEKGSITVNGVSLTVASVDAEGFEVALIPHTLEVTTLGGEGVGATVNLEVDILAKYVERLIGSPS